MDRRRGAFKSVNLYCAKRGPFQHSERVYPRHMHSVPEAIATDYHDRAAAAIEKAADQLDDSIAFVESISLSIKPQCFTAEQRSHLSLWLQQLRSAAKALRD